MADFDDIVWGLKPSCSSVLERLSGSAFFPRNRWENREKGGATFPVFRFLGFGERRVGEGLAFCTSRAPFEKNHQRSLKRGWGLKFDIFETPVAVTSQQEISKTLNSSKIPKELLHIYFSGDRLAFGEIRFILRDSRKFQGFGFFFVVVGGGVCI